MNQIKIVFIFVLVSLSQINAQFNEYNSEYEWYTIKGTNVEVHFHPEAERTAQVVLRIAEEVWDPITSLYEYEPTKVHYVIKDIEDFSNGATYFFDNKIEIWASSMDFDLRGTHNWLRNVISHEFTHMVQIQAAMKTGRTIPAFYLQFLNYEEKRRPDILYGFPNFIASYPLATINMPAWFAEGTAQYMRKEFEYDYWDSHRDMILRSYVLDGNMLTWNQMGVFEKNSLGNESVYNAGFAFTNYIARKYGEDKLRLITKKLARFSNFTVDAAIEDVLRITGDQLYSEWKSYLTEKYNKRIEPVRNTLREGKAFDTDGYANFYPRLREEDGYVYYISNSVNDYMGQTSIFRIKDSGRPEMVYPMIRSPFDFINGTDLLITSKLTPDNPGFYKIHDLYSYNLKTKEEKRLTYGLRANNPIVSPDGKTAAFVFQKDGTVNLGIINIDGTGFRQITNFTNGEQIYIPVFSNDGNKIYFDYSYSDSRDIACVNTDGSGFSFVMNEKYDERNPTFDTDGNLIYSSEETGIFNIYKLNLSTGEKQQITNVIGGAFMPATDNRGNLYYAGYTSKGYKIFRSEITDIEIASFGRYAEYDLSMPAEKVNGDINNFNLDALRNHKDRDFEYAEKSKYRGAFSKLTLFPFIRYDNYTTSDDWTDRIKPGIFFASFDMLNKFGLFGSASINKRWERDLYLSLDYRDKIPLISALGIRPTATLEVYSVSRKANADLFVGSDTLVNNKIVAYDTLSADVTYNLFEADLSFKQNFLSEKNFIEARVIYNIYSAAISGFYYNEAPYSSTDDTYLKGWIFRLTNNISDITPTVDSDVNPIGREVKIQYDYEMNKFNKDGKYKIKDGIVVPQYNDYNFHRLELNWKEYIDLGKGHTFNARVRAATIFGPQQPDFFDFYLGGLMGMKSYPFYSISGNELAWLNLTYRFPLFRNIDARVGHIYIDKIYLSVFGDLGNAWNGKIPGIDNFKKGAGAELRVKMNSFYLFPTSFFASAAYSFDEFTGVFRDQPVTYGKEWLFYGGILFSFDF